MNKYSFHNDQLRAARLVGLLLLVGALCWASRGYGQNTTSLFEYTLRSRITGAIISGRDVDLYQNAAKVYDLTESSTKPGVYSNSIISHGEYDIYVNGSPFLSGVWIGSNKVTIAADAFNNSGHLAGVAVERLVDSLYTYGNFFPLLGSTTIDTSATGQIRVVPAGITGAELAPASVSGSNLVDEAVDTQKLAPAAVGWDKLAAVVKDSVHNVWRATKIQLTDALTEQMLTTGTAPLAAPSIPTTWPSFSGAVSVRIVGKYQERGAFITTDASVAGGNISFGVTLASYGNNAADGNIYFDFEFVQR